METYYYVTRTAPKLLLWTVQAAYVTDAHRAFQKRFGTDPTLLPNIGTTRDSWRRSPVEDEYVQATEEQLEALLGRKQERQE